MGRDKALLDWHGRTLLQHMVDLISAATDRIHVVGRDPLPDRLPDHGPLSGIATALETSQTNAILVVAVDLPFLTKEFLKYLKSQAELSGSHLITCETAAGFPLCLILRRTLLPEIQRRMAANDLSIHALIETSQCRVISESEFRAAGFSASMFRNINTEEDYRTALQEP